MAVKKDKKLEMSEAKSQDLIDKFSALVKHTEELAFPNYRTGILSQPDMSSWGKVRTFFYKTTHSGLLIDSNHFWEILVYGLWSLASLTSLALGILFIDQKYYSLPNAKTNLLVNNSWVIGIAVTATILVIPVIIYWGYEVYTDKRYSINWRISITAFFALMIVWISQNISLHAQLGDWLNRDSGLALSYFVFIGPALAYLTALWLDLFLSFFYLLRVTLGGVNSLHDPLPINKINELLLKDIPTNKEGVAWHLLNLSKDEVQIIHKWAIANREATEKRIIPITIGLSLFSLLTFGNFIQKSADDFIARYVTTFTSILANPFSFDILTVIINVGIFLLILLVVTLITQALVGLFVNLAVQNIIIETCLVAEYSKKTG